MIFLRKNEDDIPHLENKYQVNELQKLWSKINFYEINQCYPMFILSFRLMMRAQVKKFHATHIALSYS